MLILGPTSLVSQWVFEQTTVRIQVTCLNTGAHFLVTPISFIFIEIEVRCFQMSTFFNCPLFAHIWPFNSKKKPESKENNFSFIQKEPWKVYTTL